MTRDQLGHVRDAVLAALVMATVTGALAWLIDTVVLAPAAAAFIGTFAAAAIHEWPTGRANPAKL